MDELFYSTPKIFYHDDGQGIEDHHGKDHRLF